METAKGLWHKFFVHSRTLIGQRTLTKLINHVALYKCMCTLFTTISRRMEFKNYPKRKPTSSFNKQSTQALQLEVLQKRLDAKIKDNGIRIFQCEILPGGVVQMGYTIPDESVLRPEEVRQSRRAKEKLERKIELLKNKVEFNSHSHPTNNQPHPPTPSPPTTNPQPTTIHPQPPTPSPLTTNPQPTTIHPQPPTTIPPPIQTNLSPKRPTRRLDTDHFTHSIIRQALLSAGNSHPRTIHK